MIRQLLRRIAAKNQPKGSFFRSASTVTYPSLNEFRTFTPDDGFILNSIYEPIVLSDLTIDQYVWRNVRAWQDKTAIVSWMVYGLSISPFTQHKIAIYQVCGVTGRQYTYARLRDHSVAVAIRLQKKFKRGDVAAICLPNIPEFPIALLGILEAGLVVTTINPIYTAGQYT